ncbi:MAG: M48 family metalloprotease, partial [Verrucomicrobiota bacterium]
MDFFEHQEQARKKSHVLVGYFVLAIVGIILAIFVLATVVRFFLDPPSQPGVSPAGLFDPLMLLTTAIGTTAAILLASGFKTMQLAAGGKVVAKELGGRLLDSATTDFHERRLLNIVEEMAIASGVPVPEVYVMDEEDSINAFAAGKTTSDAVIGVTRGCMKMLTRDELQGVIAHEFAHILNGDMRLNMRLIGLLFGILFLTLIGQMLLRSSWYVRGNRNREGGGIVLVTIVGGLGLVIIGYIGVFFANMIKAAVSRQREYLADASAVQFTRNPDGIAGALKKIGALSAGSKIRHPMARDASHLFFGTALKSDLFATHPPLADRIKQLIPSWDGDFGSAALPDLSHEMRDQKKRQKGRRRGHGLPGVPGIPGLPGGAFLAGGDMASVSMTESEAQESMSSVHPEQIALGHQILEDLPEEILELAHDEGGAQALVFSLLLKDESKAQELGEIAQVGGQDFASICG